MEVRVKKNGYTELLHYHGKNPRKGRICACCQRGIEINKLHNAVYCNNCVKYIRKIKKRYDQKMFYLRKKCESCQKKLTI